MMCLKHFRSTVFCKRELLPLVLTQGFVALQSLCMCNELSHTKGQKEEYVHFNASRCPYNHKILEKDCEVTLD